MTILIVEDHPVLRDKLAGHFSRAGFAADAVGGGADALAYLDRRNYDIMVLDLGLPDMDGMELLARRGGARCLILTARDALEDRLKGLDLGADDYVLKPFEMAELEARVRAVLRRADNAAAPVLRCGTLCFDTRSRHAAAGERPIQLSRREGMLLEELLRSSPRVVIKDVLEANGIEYRETRSLEESMPELDILYMTRVQKERFFNEEDYIRLKNSYILTSEKMALAKPEMAVLHPLPRVNEIALDVDNDPRAAYFEQVQNGVYIRMALIMTLLGLADPKAPKEGN